MNIKPDQLEPYLDWYPFPKSRLEYARFFLGFRAADRRPDQSFTSGEVFRWFAQIEAKVRRVHRRSFWKVFAAAFVLVGGLHGWFTFTDKNVPFVAVDAIHMTRGPLWVGMAVVLAYDAILAAIGAYAYVAARGSYPLDENGRILPWEHGPKDEDDRGWQPARR